MLSTFILLLIMHAFIASVARAEAELAVSEGLRAAWRSTAAVHPSAAPGPGSEPGGIQLMADAARNAVARVAGNNEGWRWWTPASPEHCTSARGGDCETVRVYSNWCAGEVDGAGIPLLPAVVDEHGVPLTDDGGQVVRERDWIRIEVVGHVIGPLASVWPGRLDRLATAAEGPAVLRDHSAGAAVPADGWRLPVPDPERDLCA
ncbi:MAG: hypothetical protein OXJ90_22950 [Spirochaetaceae bacterium]|nr:hypothetical protein [Spirochaetaceae bacterium]